MEKTISTPVDVFEAKGEPLVEGIQLESSRYRIKCSFEGGAPKISIGEEEDPDSTEGMFHLKIQYT